jgi:hypothetical protein
MENKPLILELEEAKNEIAQSVNIILQNHKIPCYLIEPTIADILAQVREVAKNELAMAREQVKGAAEAVPHHECKCGEECSCK